jgi:hypothetical protein
MQRLLDGGSCGYGIARAREHNEPTVAFPSRSDDRACMRLD